MNSAATTFTPWASLIGGVIIGLAAVLLMAGSGRIAGCAGIFRHLITLSFDSDYAWRALFVAGLLAGAALAAPFSVNAQNLSFQGTGILVIGGLLVGFGTAVGHGCTSGHGICGIGRLSPRSMVATATFLTVAIITVYVVRHVMGG